MTSRRTITRSSALTLFPMVLPAVALWAVLPNLSATGQMTGIALSLFTLIKVHTLWHYRLRDGAIHELAISVPASGGYGLPRLYFGIQGLGVLVERRLRRTLHLDLHPIPGWLWTAMITLGPAWMLFHKLFIHHVVLPLITPFTP